MNKFYQMVLQDRMEQLRLQGFATFHRWELLTWFERDKVTVIIWNEIIDRWESMVDSPESHPLNFIGSGRVTPESYLIIDTSRLASLQSESE